MQAVILAAGRGTRLLPVTDVIPKPLIPFWGRPFIAYLLDALEGLVDEAIIVDAPALEVERALGDRHGTLPLRYAVQPDPLGTGDAMLQARAMIDGPFVLLLGDTCPTRETLQALTSTPGRAVLTVIEVDDREQHSGVSVDDTGRVTGLWTEAATVDAGIFRFDSAIFDFTAAHEPLRGELRVLQGVNSLVEAGEEVRAIEMPHPWLQFGDHEGIDGVIRVMRALGEMRGERCDPGDSCVMVPARDCEVEDALVFGPGSLEGCVIRHSLVYCGADAVGRVVSDAIEVLD